MKVICWCNEGDFFLREPSASSAGLCMKWLTVRGCVGQGQVGGAQHKGSSGGLGRKVLSLVGSPVQ